MKLAFDSPGGHQFVRPSSNWRGRGPPKAEIPVRPRMAGPCGPVGELESPVPCHGTDRRFKSGQARQICEVQFDRDRSRPLKAVRRDRYPRTLPSRRTRPEYRGRSFKPLQAGSTPVGVTKICGAGCQPAADCQSAFRRIDSGRTHQAVPV